MISYIIALTLVGGISNCEGRIGIRTGGGNKVTHVYDHASARGLIYVGDKILESDGYKGVDNIMGAVGTEVHIKLQRCGSIKEFDIIRIPKPEVFDDKK